MNETLINFLYSAIFFFLGIIGGMLIILLIHLILKSLSKKRIKEDLIDVNNKLNIDELVKKNKELYLELVDKSFKSKYDSIKKCIKELTINISKLYYPTSKNSIEEIKIKNFLRLIKELNQELLIKYQEIINSNIFNLVWKAYVTINNVKGYFKKLIKKEDSEYLKYDINQLTIRDILNIVDKLRKDHPQDNNFNILNHYIDNKMLEFIDFASGYIEKAYIGFNMMEISYD